MFPSRHLTPSARSRKGSEGQHSQKRSPKTTRKSFDLPNLVISSPVQSLTAKRNHVEDAITVPVPPHSPGGLTIVFNSYDANRTNSPQLGTSPSRTNSPEGSIRYNISSPFPVLPNITSGTNSPVSSPVGSERNPEIRFPRRFQDSPSCTNKRPEENYPVCRTNSKYYNMINAQRGIFLVFNFNVLGQNNRGGAEKDTENLRTCFTKLGFEVIPYHDIPKSQVLQILDQYTRKDHSNNDCFGVALLGHGDEGYIYTSNNEAISLESIFEKVKRCSSLLGKPKLFFIQACRKCARQIEEDAEVILKMPQVSINADHLVSYATQKGNAAFRIPETGSPYILKLTELLEKNGDKESLLDVLTQVNYEVQSMVNEFNESQIAVFESALQKKLVFDKVEKQYTTTAVYEMADGRLEYE